MNESKDIKKMSRRDLLEVLVLQSKKIDELQEELNKTSELLNTKQIMISEAGNIAEASLKLNKIFEVAQTSAEQYLESIKAIEEKQEKLRLELENKLKKKKKKKSTKKKKTDKTKTKLSTKSKTKN